MLIFAFWDSTESAPPRQAELVSAFHRACLAAGDTPRLLTARDALKSRRYRNAVAAGTANEASMSLWALRAKRGKHFTYLRYFEKDLQ